MRCSLCGSYIASVFLYALFLFPSTGYAVVEKPATLEQGIIEYRAENYEEAISIFQKIKQEQPNSSVASFYLGLTYKQTGDYKEGAKQFRDAVNLTPPVLDAYPELIEMLYNIDELREAHEWITKAEALKIRPSYIAYLKGLVLIKEGKNSDAVDAFKKAREIDSSLAQSCDLQIAVLQAKLGKMKGARDSLNALIKINPTSELADFAREYEKAIAATLAAYKPLRLNMGLAYQYDTNVVSQPSSIIGIESIDKISGKKDSSIVGTFRIEYAPLIDAPWSFDAQYNYYTNDYFNAAASKFDVMSHTLSLTPGYSIKNGAITLPVSDNMVYLNNNAYLNLVSVKPTLNIMLLPGHIGQLSAGYGKREMFQEKTPGFSPDERRDGDLYSVSAGYLYPFSEGRGMFNLRYEYSIEDTEGKNWVNSGNRITVSLLVPVVKKLNLMLTGDVFFQQYTNINTTSGTGTPGYPDTPTKRKDTVYMGSAGLSYELYSALKVNLTYSHTKDNSNFKIYDYGRDLYSAGIEYNY